MISEKDLLAKVPTQLYIDGAWVDATGGKTIPVTDPATGEILAHIADAQPEDGIRCLDAAVAAQDAWAQTAPRVRGEGLSLLGPDALLRLSKSSSREAVRQAADQWLARVT
jgi:delta 1-pyrroline-5-carboxylate dehydrogenase